MRVNPSNEPNLAGTMYCFSFPLFFVFCWQWCMQCCSTAQCYTSRIYHAYASTLSVVHSAAKKWNLEKIFLFNLITANFAIGCTSNPMQLVFMQLPTHCMQHTDSRQSDRDSSFSTQDIVIGINRCACHLHGSLVYVSNATRASVHCNATSQIHQTLPQDMGPACVQLPHI